MAVDAPKGGINKEKPFHAPRLAKYAHRSLFDAHVASYPFPQSSLH